ncbi:MAG: GyrI-like domain-containing protein [Elainella sp.]
MEGRYAGLNVGVNEQLTEQLTEQFTEAKPLLVHQPERMMMGVEVQLTPEQTVQPGSADLVKIWNRFLTEQMLDDIPDVINPQILYGLYADYSNSSPVRHCRPALTQFSTILIVATEVSSIDNPPEGMVGLAIPAADYLMFSAGQQPALRTWQQIWSYFAEVATCESAHRRAYTIDFERHEADRVDIYVAVQ